MIPLHSLGPRYLGYCRWCGRLVRRDELADVESRREYDATATCLACQGAGGFDPARPPVARLHAVVVVADDAAAPSEIALVPFRFVPSLDEFEWDPHHVVRAGAWEGSDPFAELAPARAVWARRGLQVHVLGVERFDDPLLSARIARTQVVVCLDDTQVAYFARRCVDRPLPLPAFVDSAIGRVVGERLRRSHPTVGVIGRRAWARAPPRAARAAMRLGTAPVRPRFGALGAAGACWSPAGELSFLALAPSAGRSPVAPTSVGSGRRH